MVDEERLKKQSSDSNPTPERCWLYGWNAANSIKRMQKTLNEIETHRLPPSEGLKDGLSRAVDELINNNINSGCKRFDTERILEFKGRLQYALRKEDWREVENALNDIAFVFNL
jgi:hypothetical protein